PHRPSRPGDHDGHQHEFDLSVRRLAVRHQRPRPRSPRPCLQRLRHPLPHGEFEEGARYRRRLAAVAGRSVTTMAEAHVKRALPSLIGGIFTAIVAFVLWLLLFGTASYAIVALGALVAIGLGAWIRLADL